MKILLGLSGGVDSAVAAYLLKEQGYEVTCCFMRNWDSLINNDIKGNPTLTEDICPQEKDYNDAVAVAKKLNLPLVRVDYIKEYYNDVFENFISEYKLGRTPNPDILCNKYIKFAKFLDYAMDNGYDMIATGHYAKVLHKEQSYLLRAKDTNKDQTYFLSQISQKALSKTLFPLGDYTKEDIRLIAKQQDLPIANKKDSTGICFIGERDFREFLKNYIPANSGDIYDIDYQEVVGQHQGVMYYTVGQRKGLAVGGNRGPYFVVGKDVKKNVLFVSNKDEEFWLNSTSCLVKDLNLFNDIDLSEVKSAKFRYRQKDYPVSVTKVDKGVLVKYPLGAKSVTCGQQAVFFNENVCLGGGIIDKVYIQDKLVEDLIEDKCKQGLN